MAPRYTRPDVPIPKEWPEGAAYKEIKPEEGPSAQELKWRGFHYRWKAPEDYRDMALKNNRDFKIAAYKRR
jgi:multidrug efflux system outer membrane protein